MRLLKFQVFHDGPWYTAGIYHEDPAPNKYHVTVYDNENKLMNVFIGVAFKETEIPVSEGETLVEFGALEYLEPGKTYFIPNTQWAFTVGQKHG
jgi:hypothetical protein